VYYTLPIVGEGRILQQRADIAIGSFAYMSAELTNS
jgi:hypothetical protein